MSFHEGGGNRRGGRRGGRNGGLSPHIDDRERAEVGGVQLQLPLFNSSMERLKPFASFNWDFGDSAQRLAAEHWQDDRSRRGKEGGPRRINGDWMVHELLTFRSFLLPIAVFVYLFRGE